METVALTKHQTFYFERDGNVIFRVEETLFRVHKYYFMRDSETFNTMFSLPSPHDTPPEGDSDDNPIHLLGVRAIDFERLLLLMYPPRMGVVSLETLDEWTSILELATRYDFTDARDLAINALGRASLDPIAKIALAQQYDISVEWMINAVIELAMRERPLNIEEAERIGFPIFVKLTHARELLHHSREVSCATCQNLNLQFYCDSCQDYSEIPSHMSGSLDARAVVHEIFGVGRFKSRFQQA